MRRRRLLVLAGVVLAVALIVPAAREVYAYRQNLVRGRLIDRKHFEQIKKGMRCREVWAILGGPPGDFSTREVWYLGIDSPRGHGRYEEWTGDDGQILVVYDPQGMVWRKFLDKPVPLPPPPFSDRVRAWLRHFWP